MSDFPDNRLIDDADPEDAAGQQPAAELRAPEDAGPVEAGSPLEQEASTEAEPYRPYMPQAPTLSEDARSAVRGRRTAVSAGRRSMPAARRGGRWYKRPVVMYPGMFVLVFVGIFTWHWFNTPIETLAGESTTRWNQTKKFVANLAQPKASLEKSFNGKQQITVLLIGLDHVPKTRKDPGIIHRNDSTLVATTDFRSKQIRLASIPRDGWVQHWEDGKNHGYDKFGFTYAFGQSSAMEDKSDIMQGGVNRVRETAEHLLDIKVDQYVLIEFDGFIKLIDAMGGLDIDVEKKMKWDDNAGDLHINLKPGMQHLDGERVMQYARFRHDAMSDKGRMLRQQKVIHLTLAKLKSPEMLPKLPELMRIMHECVHTSFSLDQLLALAQHMDEYNLDEMESMSLPSYWAGEPGHERKLPGLSDSQQYAHRYEEYIAPGDMQAVHDFLMDLNAPPRARASLSVDQGQAPLTVSVDATDSSDRDGSVASYEFDWNGDGKFEEQSPEPLASHEYQKAGEYTVKVRVLDEKGKPSQPLSLPLKVHPPAEQARLREPGSSA